MNLLTLKGVKQSIHLIFLIQLDNYLMKSNFFLLISLLLFLSCQQEEAPQRPNILFAIADDQSFPHAGAYGCSWVSTPAFDKVAREGLLFTQAFTPNAKCAPSRACILTGRNSWQLEEAANHWCVFPEKFTTFPEVLHDNGYEVGRTGKGWAPGVAMRNGEPRELIGKVFNDQKRTPPAGFMSPLDYAENFKQFLGERKAEAPFMFWYGGFEPHRAYEFQAGMKKGNKVLTKIEDVPPFWPDTDTVRADMLDYAYEIEYFDQQLGKMLDVLEEEGLLENTIVIVTSDNGMPFPRVKGQVYEYDHHLPLAIMWGDGIQNPGRVIEEYVNFIDFAPTLLEVAGVSPTSMQPMTGQSLTSLMQDQPDPTRNDYVLIGKERHDIGRPNDEGYPVRGIIKGEYAYTLNFKPDRWPAGNPETGYLNTDGSPTKTVILNERRRLGSSTFWDVNFGKRVAEELYHLPSDPYCMTNLALSTEHDDEKAALKELLISELTQQQDPRILGNGDIFDDYLYADKRQTNFYEQFMEGKLGPKDAGWVNPGDFEPETP